MKTKVLIADDHPLVRSGVRRALEEEHDIEVVGEATNGAKVLPLIGQTGPDLVVLDISMPQLDGLACLDQIRKRYPDVKVVILSASGDPDRVQAALARGATAYVLKSVDVRDLASRAAAGDRGNRLPGARSAAGLRWAACGFGRPHQA